MTGEPPMTIKGLVIPIPAARHSIWMRLVPLIDNATPSMDYPVQVDGSFEFAGMAQGEYLLLAVRDGKCIHTEQVAPSGRLITIDLNAVQ